MPKKVSLLFLLFLLISGTAFVTFAPDLAPGLVIRYSPFLGPYLDASSNMAGNNLPSLFDFNVDLRDEWISKTNGRFGDISSELGHLARSGKKNKVEMAIYLLRCINSASARLEIEKLKTVNDRVITIELTRPIAISPSKGKYP